MGRSCVDVETMLEWAKSMTWKGIHPVVAAEPQGVSKRDSAWARKRCRTVESRLGAPS